jgi:hypothetical protein
MAATEADVPATETAEGTPALRDRLVSPLPTDRILGWLGPLPSCGSTGSACRAR